MSFPESQPTKPAIKRWYDRDPDLSWAVGILRQMQPEYQALFARHLLEFSHERLLARRARERVSQVGSEKISGLMKSQRRQRWYDQDKLMYRTFQKLSILESKDLADLGKRLRSAISFSGDFAFQALRQDKVIRKHLIQQLVKIVFENGSIAGVDYLKQFSFWDDQMIAGPLYENPLLSKNQGKTAAQLANIDEKPEPAPARTAPRVEVITFQPSDIKVRTDH